MDSDCAKTTKRKTAEDTEALSFELRRIDELLKSRNMSQYQLTKAIGKGGSTVSNLFRRKTSPTINTLRDICGALEITMAEFFRETDDIIELSEGQKKLLELYEHLTNEEKAQVLAYAEGLVAGRNGRRRKNKKDDSNKT